MEANLSALEKAQELEQANRHAAAEELKTLGAYTGWGGLVEFFDETSADYAESRARLRATVSPEAYHTLRGSILNAHYTPPELAEAIWDPLREAAAGTDRLRVLEPGSGTGIFFRASGLAGTGTEHEFVGVEVDEMTARISSLLHPEAEIHHAGFERTRFAEDSFDLSVGNVPFGNWTLPDARHNTAGLRLHNHFIYKALAHTAPGGYAAIITSRYTMDAKTTTARRALASQGDLVGAVRLPEGTHRGLSGTEVGTDVLIFRKRAPGEEPHPGAERWLETDTMTVTDSDGVPHEVNYNGYFADNPQYVIGEVRHSSNPLGPGYEIRAGAEVDIAESVRSHITAMTTTTDLQFNPQREVSPVFVPDVIHREPEPAARYGHVRFNSESQVFEEYTSNMEWAVLERKRQPNKKDRAESLQLLGLRDTARELVSAQRDGTSAEDRVGIRDRLRQQWGTYTEAYGPLNRRVENYKTPSPSAQQSHLREAAREWLAENHPELAAETLPDETVEQLIADPESDSITIPEDVIDGWRADAKQKVLDGYTQTHLKALRNDPSLGVLLAVENLDRSSGIATPSNIMERDVVTATVTATNAETAEEAIGISMAERGHVDTARVAELLGISEDELEPEIDGLVFNDPDTGRVEPAARYLSGDVRAKLESAEAAAENDPAYETNAAALRTVVPETISLDEVTINPGVPWLETELYEQFASETFGTSVEITYDQHAPSGKWRVEPPSSGFSEQVNYQWGTSHRSAKPRDVLEKTLNSQVFRLTKPDPADPENKRIPDPRASDAANDKADQLKEAFRTWIRADSERAAVVEARYNRLFNSIVPADYTDLARSLQFPGIAADRQPYAYQRTAVVRALNEPAVLLDHVVGAGKTGSMIMTAMEKRRLGHANKPALVVPNHLVGQISAEWKQWYPNAEVMTIPGGLPEAERREQFGRAGAGDWDAVILGETVFNQVSIDPTRHQAMLESDIEQARSAVANMEEGGSSRAAIRKAEKSVKKMEKDYDRLAKKPDMGLVFEETGIDFLMVDEAHHFKNLQRVSDVPELDEATGSERARNLDYILRAMREDKVDRAKAEGTWTPGYVPSVALFSTGTPVANKVSEMWVMQKYLRPDLLEERGIEDVTAWGDTFTEQDWRVIATPDGRYQRQLKVTGFANVPELLAFNRSFQDSVTRSQIEVPLPSITGGERQLHISEPSEEVQAFMVDLQDRVDMIKKGSVDPSDDNVLKIVHEGRMAALDPRLMGMDAPADGGRAADVADQIMRIDHQTQDQVTVSTDTTGQPSRVTGGLQIVFADLSTPKPAEPERFTIYDQLKRELTERGMDPERIAFIHDAAADQDRTELFRKAREGELSVLMGSTQKMGTGMNVQNRATALHHIDPPWRPADVEQREGRIIRQGNLNPEVEIHAYGTAGTTDTFMWSKLSQKAGFIEQLKNPTGVGRTMEDPLAGLDATAANAQAVLSGDPRIGDLLNLESEINSLERLEHQHHSAQAQGRTRIREHQRSAELIESRLPGLRQLAEKVTPTTSSAFSMTTPDGQLITQRAEAGKIIAGHVRRAAFIAEADALQPSRPVTVGTLGGAELKVFRHLSNVHLATEAEGHETRIGAIAVQNNNKSPEGLIRSTEHLVASTSEKITQWDDSANKHRHEAAALGEAISQQWGKAEELEQKRQAYAELKADLGLDGEDEEEELATPAKLSSDEIGVLMPAGTKLESPREVRDGDVLRLQGGPSSDDRDATGYYQARWDRDPDEGTRLMVWPDDAEPDQAEEISFSPFFNSKVQLASRLREALTPMETRRVDLANEPTAVYRTVHQLPDKAKVQAQTATGELITGTIDRHHATGGGMRSVALVPDDGSETIPFYANRDTGTQIDTSAGVMQLDYEPSTPSTDANNGHLVGRLAHGCRLTEDVEGIGKAGDLLVTTTQRHGMTNPAALDPATGRAVAIKSVYGKRLTPDQYSPAVMLDDAEKAKLGWHRGPKRVAAAALRPGDQVIGRDLIKDAATGEPVSITSVSSRYSRKAHIGYINAEGNQQGVEIKPDAEIRVLNRARAHLNIEEVTTLSVQPTGNMDGPIPIPPSVRATTPESLIDHVPGTSESGPELVIQHHSDHVRQIVTGQLAAAEAVDEHSTKVRVITADTEKDLVLENWRDEVVIPAHRVEIIDLNLAGESATQPPEPQPQPVPETGRGIVFDPTNLEQPFSWAKATTPATRTHDQGQVEKVAAEHHTRTPASDMTADFQQQVPTTAKELREKVLTDDWEQLTDQQRITRLKGFIADKQPAPAPGVKPAEEQLPDNYQTPVNETAGPASEWDR